MSRAIFIVALVLCLAALTAAQYGPQLLFPLPARSVVRGQDEMNPYQMKVRALNADLGQGIVHENQKPFYKPPKELNIRAYIRSRGGLDPLGNRSPYVLRQMSNGRAVAAAADGSQGWMPAGTLSANRFAPQAIRGLPSIKEYQGLGGANGKVAPRGVKAQPWAFGPKSTQRTDGPFVSFMEMDSSVDNLDIDALAARGRSRSSSTQDVNLETELQSLLAVGSKLNLNDETVAPKNVHYANPISSRSGAINFVRNLQGNKVRLEMNKNMPALDNLQFPQDIASSLSQNQLITRTGLEKPTMVRQLGNRMSLLETQAQEKALLAKATVEAQNAMASYAAAEAEVEAAAQDAEKAQAEADKVAAVEHAEAQAMIEAHNEITALEQHYTKMQAEKAALPTSQSFLQAEAQSKAQVDQASQADLDALAEAVAAQSIQRQTSLTNSAITKLKQQIVEAKTQASAESLKPWWLTDKGQRENMMNKEMHGKLNIPAVPNHSFIASQTNQKKSWNPPTPLKHDPTSFMQIRGGSGYASVPTLSTPTAAPGARAPLPEAAPASFLDAGNPKTHKMYENPGPAGQAVVKLQPLANPYAFSSTDLLYPQLRGAWGVSGVPPNAVGALQNGPHRQQAPAQVPVAAPAAAAGTGANTIVINVAPASMPAVMPPRPITTQTTTNTNFQNVGGNPFSFFPGPAPARVLHTGAPTPGSQLSDNASFGELKV